MRALCISAIGSNQGKTILTTALLSHFKNSVRPFKIGPDFIDPQFHTRIALKESINLDTFIMNEEQVKWMFAHYSDADISICEGVMGFYDGMDKGCSAYDVAKLLNIPTILIIDGSSSYITLSAVLKGLKSYREDNTIKGVVFNKVSSESHFTLIKNTIEKDFDDVLVLGWIQKSLQSLSDTHLGLDLEDMDKIETISQEVLEHIDMQKLDALSQGFTPLHVESYPFEKVAKIDKKIAIVYDKNFSFLYPDNVAFLKEVFAEVVFVSATKDEKIEADIVFIPGGYVESEASYGRIKNVYAFKNSLIEHAKTKPVYAECAGMLYLANRVDEKEMAGILDLDFTLHDRFQRLGYYYNSQRIKGHAFHYTNVVDAKEGKDILSKEKNGVGKVGSWREGRVYGTYLHTMFRSNVAILKEMGV